MREEIGKEFINCIKRIQDSNNLQAKENEDVIIKEMMKVLEKEKQKAFMEGYRYAVSILLESIADKEQ